MIKGFFEAFKLALETEKDGTYDINEGVWFEFTNVPDFDLGGNIVQVNIDLHLNDDVITLLPFGTYEYDEEELKRVWKIAKDDITRKVESLTDSLKLMV